MELYADRLAKLAGLPVGKTQTLSEASNRSMHDDVVSDEAEHRFGKNQLAEYSTGKGDKDPKEANEGSCMSEEEQEEGMRYEGEGMQHEDDAVVIDEEMLQEEIARMRRERLEENELRSIIRGEIGSIVSQMKKSRASGRKKDSGKFSGVTTGFPGPGFR